jgi:hypothetical protein
LSRAIWISVYITAARSPPRSDPANSHAFSARSAVLLVRQMRPSARKREKVFQRLSI